MKTSRCEFQAVSECLTKASRLKKEVRAVWKWGRKWKYWIDM